MSESIVYVRRSYVKEGAPDISDKDQETAVRRAFGDDHAMRVIRDSYDPDDPTSKRKHSGATEDRDGYQELIALIRSGRAKRVGVYDLSRLNRDTRAMLNLKAEMDRQGVHLVVADMPNSQFDTAAGKFQFGVMCMAAQFQRDLDMEKAKRRTRRIYEDQGHNGLDPYGYRTIRDEQGRIVHPRNLRIVEGEAEVVVRIWRDLAYQSQEQVARALNAEGVPSRSGRPWTKDMIKDIWRRGRFYLGFAVWRRPGHAEYEERPGRHSAILDEQTYRDALMATRNRGPGAGRRPLPFRTYIVKGKLEHECRRPMRGQALTSRGVEWRYYRCPVCPKASIQAEEAERAVLDALRTGMLPLQAMREARDELARRLRVPTAGVADKQRQRLTTALEQIRKQNMWGDLSDDKYACQKRDLRRQLEAIPDSDKLVQFDSHRKVVLSLAESIDKASPKRLAELVRLLVVRVPVVDGKVDPARIVWTPAARPFFDAALLGERSEGFEPPTPALGRRRSIH
jgi:DNA invertase Pin-like site-specific DNA recombinase